MGRSMKGTGKMIYNMALERKLGQMDLTMRESIMKEGSMGKDLTNGQMEVHMLEIGVTTK